MEVEYNNYMTCLLLYNSEGWIRNRIGPPRCVFYSVAESSAGFIIHRYDDYDYGEVNQLLERDLKIYIKAVACCPDATKSPVCPRSMVPLKTSERVSGVAFDSWFVVQQ